MAAKVKENQTEAVDMHRQSLTRLKAVHDAIRLLESRIGRQMEEHNQAVAIGQSLLEMPNGVLKPAMKDEFEAKLKVHQIWSHFNCNSFLNNVHLFLGVGKRVGRVTSSAQRVVPCGGLCLSFDVDGSRGSIESFCHSGGGIETAGSRLDWNRQPSVQAGGDGLFLPFGLRPSRSARPRTVGLCRISGESSLAGCFVRVFGRRRGNCGGDVADGPVAIQDQRRRSNGPGCHPTPLRQGAAHVPGLPKVLRPISGQPAQHELRTLQRL